MSGRIDRLEIGNTTAVRGLIRMAVRASSSVPGIFLPVRINGHDYVDGGLVSQVPIKIARRLGADVVIAADVSRLPKHNTRLSSTLDVLHQSLLIISQAIVDAEADDADVLIRPDLSDISLAGFDQRPSAIAAGEWAALALVARIREIIDQKARR